MKRYYIRAVAYTFYRKLKDNLTVQQFYDMCRRAAEGDHMAFYVHADATLLMDEAMKQHLGRSFGDYAGAPPDGFMSLWNQAFDHAYTLLCVSAADPNTFSREELLRVTKFNDPNGIWSDEACEREDIPPATKEELIETWQRWADEEGMTLLQCFSDVYSRYKPTYHGML